ncbi:hypothetical protein EXIGLDRAFT_653919 [Exidia glandulosa HHB12029]|uniref:Inositolphosphotransferase Aur1/Ipt1 domain-containing protein n=1 Tax=Exidia glandulosa HHB12029 TaxID=1314781 RepID=A0A165DY87_EXIGL|nr:hypothetical protein EXIGLDRAFT_653919 [Exidia glandulosa HHB12029]
MGLGAFLEPLVVVSLLFGGAYFNRDRNTSISRAPGAAHARKSSGSRSSSPDSVEALLGTPAEPTASATHQRRVQLFGWSKEFTTPNTAIYEDRLLSRVLRKFPFLAECWYWALIYWTYQVGRALTALTLQQDTVDVARRHALQLIAVEQRLHMFVEPAVQQYFLQYPSLMKWINWLYSFIHIPGTIFFLAWLFWYCITRNLAGDAAGAWLYEARRRTMAMCNLLAFIVFTLWPCMPPRLLSDASVKGAEGDLSRSYGFVDTVHGAEGASSVWTQNRFCNQYAAMPSLHFGYSLMIGLTIMSLPLAPSQTRTRSLYLPLLPRVRLPSFRRMACIAAGFLYPFVILVAIVSTANHFVLDAVAGACVCGLGWWSNSFLLNLLPLEDYFLSALRIHKPQHRSVSESVEEFDQESKSMYE